MRHALVLIIALTCVTTALGAQPAVPVSSDQPLFVLTGGGWGHAVGLSQWGAFGQAQAGRTYDRILAQYFRGTTITETPVKTVRVLVAQGAHSLTIDASAPFKVRDANGSTYRYTAAQLRLGPRLRLPALDPGSAVGVATTQQVGRPVPPLTFVPANGTTLTLDGKGYRGALEVKPVQGTLQAVMIVGLDAYVRGIVPGEMPKEWPVEALKAQAVATRTFALASFVQGRDWDVVADPRNFAYYGVGAEAPSTDEAVKETAGQVLTYRGKVITAFYFSSSGGRTLSSQDVFGVTIPYLQGAADPWDASSPYHRWSPRTFTPASLASALGEAGVVDDVQIVPSAPGRSLGLRLMTSGGAAVQLPWDDVRTRLGLRSPNFSVGVLRLDAVPDPVPPKGPATLTGTARDVGSAVLELRDRSGLWKAAKTLVVRADGSFTVVVRPTATTEYRLSAAGLIGPSTVVTVSSSAAP